MKNWRRIEPLRESLNVRRRLRVKFQTSAIRIDSAPADARAQEKLAGGAWERPEACEEALEKSVEGQVHDHPRGAYHAELHEPREGPEPVVQHPLQLADIVDPQRPRVGRSSARVVTGTSR